jgi:hypothetical protein
MKLQLCGMSLTTALWMVGCSPTVRVEAPDKPIEINMNIKIQHEIRIKVEKDIDQMLKQNKELF